MIDAPSTRPVAHKSFRQRFLALLLMVALGILSSSSPLWAQGSRSAVFAGGCFWCMEPPYDKLDGVISTTSGYMGGTIDNPTYRQVSSGQTGHTEVMEVVYDPEQVSYQELLDIFWRNIDPVDRLGQFCDRGSQYRSEIFVQTEEERQLAEASKAELQPRFDRPIATEITDASTFYPAEDYHQDYYQENPVRYQIYRLSCGRDARLNAVWGSEAGGH